MNLTQKNTQQSIGAKVASDATNNLHASTAPGRLWQIIDLLSSLSARLHAVEDAVEHHVDRFIGQQPSEVSVNDDPPQPEGIVGELEMLSRALHSQIDRIQAKLEHMGDL